MTNELTDELELCLLANEVLVRPIGRRFRTRPFLVGNEAFDFVGKFISFLRCSFGEESLTERPESHQADGRQPVIKQPTTLQRLDLGRDTATEKGCYAKCLVAEFAAASIRVG